MLCHSHKVGHTRDDIFHLLLVLYIGFLPFGVFQFIAETLLVCVGDGLADKIVLTLKLVYLRCQLALCMGSYECWMMMLGRRGMDVMKLARIIGLSLCITYSSYICESLKMPGKGLEEVTRQMAQSKNREVAALELKVAQKQDDYLKRLRQVQDSIETAKQVQEIGEDAHWWDKLIYNMENLGSTINNYAQRAAVAAETKVSEWINDVIRFVGELIFQMSYYGMLVAQRIFMTIMATFAPIMFALSIVPPWSNAWAQWMGKYLSLSLWGFVVYFCLYYIDFILMYNLMEDIKAYDTLLRGTVNSWQQIGALGLQGIGSNCMYAMGMLVGAYVLRFVPEVASWLIPGGISSSAGTASGAGNRQCRAHPAGPGNSPLGHPGCRTGAGLHSVRRRFQTTGSVRRAPPRAA